MRRSKPLAPDRIRECLRVDVDDGRLFWQNVSKYHAEKNGKEAGGPVANKDGKVYWVVGIDGAKRKRAQIIFAIANGYWSEKQVIHANGNSVDDRISNLYEDDHHGASPSSPINEDQRFGALVTKCVIGKSKDNHRLWLCECDCGGEKVMQSNNLQSAKMPSCGCLTFSLMSEAIKKHGMRGTPEYSSWRSMLYRCHTETSKDFARYGAIGRFVCDEWRSSFEAFYAHIGPRPAGTTLDRIENSKGYVSGNVRWADAQTQARNRDCSAWISVAGNVIHLADYADQLGITLGAAHLRLKRGQLLGVERV